MFLRLVLLFLASEGLYLLLAVRSRASPDLFEGSPVFFGVWAALFAAYALAVRAVREKAGGVLFFLIFATSALFRVSLLLQNNGFATETPDAFLQAASPLRAAMESIPGSEAYASVAFELGSLALMTPLLRALSLPSGLALVYGWNPLLVKEGAGSGRLEAIPLFFLLLAFLLLQKKRPGAAAVFYGASLAGPPLFWATLPLAARALGVRAGLSLVVSGLAWARLAATSSVAELLGWPPSSEIGGSLMPAAATFARLFVTRDPLAPLLFCAGTFLLLALSSSRKLGGRIARLPREALVLWGSVVFLAPEVLPWAFIPIAGLAAFSENPGWLVFTATAPLTYLALGGGNWSFWLAFAQYFPGYASLVFVALGSNRGRKPSPGKASS